MQHRAVVALGGADEAQAAEHVFAAEARIQRSVMTQAIEDRQHGGIGANRWRDRVDRAVQVIGLAAEDDQIEGCSFASCGKFSAVTCATGNVASPSGLRITRPSRSSWAARLARTGK